MSAPASVISRIKKLRTTIDHHRFLYHVRDESEISEAALDSLKDELKKIEQEYPELVTADSPTQRVAGAVLDAFEKVPHKVRQWSFDDAFNKEDLEQFVIRARNILAKESDSTDFAFLAEQKIDGLKVILEYQNGLLQTAATRGDGVVGENVTENAKTIESIPLKLTSNVSGIFEGEIFMAKSSFESLNTQRAENGEELFANPRNAAAGTMRQLDSSIVAQRKLSCFVYDIADLGTVMPKTQQQELEMLETLGFTVNTERKLCESIDKIFDFYNKQQQTKESFNYWIDGLVIKINEIEIQNILGYTGKSPRHSIALKFPAEQTTTVVENISLQVGRTGVITPIAELRPVSIAGSTVARATLHNAEEIERLDVRVGDTVIIEKAGDIIPKVVEVVLSLRPTNTKQYAFPTKIRECGGDGSIEKIEGQVAYRCVSLDSADIQKKRLEYFASKKAINIDGLGPQLLNRLYDAGLVATPADIYSLQKDDLLQLEGFKERSVQKLLDSIETTREIPFKRFITALGLPEVGEESALLLADKFDVIQDLRDAETTALENIHGIGSVVAENIVQWFAHPDNVRLVNDLLQHVSIAYDTLTQSHAEITDKTFVITGSFDAFSRDDIKDMVRSYGGKIGSSVSKNTDVLIAGTKAGSKLQKAQEMKTTIWDEEHVQGLML